MQQKDKEIVGLHQLLECQCHESAKSLIVANKRLGEQVKKVIELQIVNIRYHDQVHNCQTIMLVMAIHKLNKYDNGLLKQTLVDIHTHALQQKPSRWEAWWDKVWIIIQGMFNKAFESQNVDEALYQHKLPSYAIVYHDHIMWCNHL